MKHLKRVIINIFRQEQIINTTPFSRICLKCFSDPTRRFQKFCVFTSSLSWTFNILLFQALDSKQQVFLDSPQYCEDI